jgi:trk system potassium uptake protein TrkH
MISFKTIARYLGMLIILEGILLFLCLIVAFYYGESQVKNFALTSGVAFIVGLSLYYACKAGRKNPNRREAYFIVGIVWIIFSFIGMLPFLQSGFCPSVSTAFFEAMSGFTTTGVSALNNIDSLPHSLLFWRSLTHWIGGLGIVFFTITLLPNNFQGGSQLLTAEKIGLSTEKIHPRSSTTAKWLWSLYAFLTLVCALCLWGCGMTLFDSLNFSMSTMATGGFAPRADGVLYYNSPCIDFVIIVFMFIAGMNFSLLYLAIFKHKVKALFKNEELRFFLYVLLALGTVSAVSLIMYNHYPPLHAVRVAFFNIVSLQTTTGFVSDNYAMWFPPLWLIILVVNMMGACAGSTTGGLKAIRILIVFKTATCQFKRLLHPNAVIPIRVNKVPVYESTEHVLLSYFVLFFFLIFCGAVAFSAIGLPLLDSASLAISCVANIGPISGHMFGPYDDLNALPAIAKWLCSFLMLAGRLEVFSVMLPLTMAFWKKD